MGVVKALVEYAMLIFDVDSGELMLADCIGTSYFSPIETSSIGSLSMPQN
jgi:hypothetical protein